MRVRTRARRPAVALETTLLVHGVPAEAALPLADDLERDVASCGAHAAVVGVVDGVPTVGMDRHELRALVAGGRSVPKCNTSNLGLVLHRRLSAATTVSATVEIAASAGVSVFATGGLGGVHRGTGRHLDISADLAALARFPVAVFASGVKSMLDVVSTRELLETLGVPVVGFGTDRFPAFYLVDGGCGVDGRFDDADDLAAFVRMELSRSGRGALVVQPVPAEHAIAPADLDLWLAQAERECDAQGRDVTPVVLDALHRCSRGATLRANVALVRANAALAARVAAAMERR